MGKKKDKRRAAAAAASVQVAAPAPPPGPAAAAAPAPAPAEADRTGRGLMTLRRLVGGIDGSRMCFGEPIQAGSATVIPVARVWAAGGAGFGHGEPLVQDGSAASGAESGGGGLGGALEGHPVGFITIAADGTSRYEAIPDPQGRARAVRMLASGAATLLTAAAASRALRGGAGAVGRGRRARRPRGLLPRGD